MARSEEEEKKFPDKANKPPSEQIESTHAQAQERNRDKQLERGVVLYYGHAAVGAAEELDGRSGGAGRDDTVLGQLVLGEDPAGPPGSVAAAHPDQRPHLRVRPRDSGGELVLSTDASHPGTVAALTAPPPSPAPPPQRKIDQANNDFLVQERVEGSG